MNMDIFPIFQVLTLFSFMSNAFHYTDRLRACRSELMIVCNSQDEMMDLPVIVFLPDGLDGVHTIRLC